MEAEEVYVCEVVFEWWGKVTLVDLVKDEVEIFGGRWEFGLDKDN